MSEPFNIFQMNKVEDLPKLYESRVLIKSFLKKIKENNEIWD